ncbi:carbohydrate ABC transporter permease [Paenibacillus dokdonensis]|uniref:Carbohydrate ABC transporter permease n=1 Tax=Paenibacillus dokdonensis TaxID=2567944 RepID=A0ABU6GGL8_9BACL|nr:carbohydrate ABC transporter permease [Paenibacillus dokdonensis]MEC0238358.1 carbohydrate ABC transporter permease [Paenibacillus dokdonensis]
MIARKTEQWVINIVFIAISFLCLIPFILLVASSVSSEDSIIQNGYTLFPTEFSLESYSYLFKEPAMLIRAYGISIFITVIGTVISLIVMTLLAYPISRRDMPLRNAISFFIFFTMLFNGGLVPTYLMYTNVFQIKNTLFALLIPGLLVSAFFVILIRTFFTMNIPNEVIESAYMDGASEFKIFARIVLPLSTPVLGAVGLFQLINYWNDWFNGLIYITDSKLYSIQVLLNTILLNAQYLASNTHFVEDMTSADDIPNHGLKMAIAAIGVIPILVTYPFFQKYFAKGLTVGAVKG